MSENWASGERAKRMASKWAIWGGICWILAIIFAILGIISEATSTTLGLTTLSWYMLAIALFVASIPEYIGWAVGVLYKK